MMAGFRLSRIFLVVLVSVWALSSGLNKRRTISSTGSHPRGNDVGRLVNKHGRSATVGQGHSLHSGKYLGFLDEQRQKERLEVDDEEVRPLSHSRPRLDRFSISKPKDVRSKFQNDSLRYAVALDTTEDFVLHWDTDFEREIILFRLEANIGRSDALAFGFSAYGEPTNADLVVLWTDLKGRHWFQDAHTDDRGILVIDAHQDYIFDGSKETVDGRLAVEFHRRFDTCDNDDYLIDSGTTHLIFFVSHGPHPGIRHWNVTAERPTLQRVQLLKSQLPDPAFPPDTKTFVMHVDDVRVPEDETTYWCAVRKLPDFKEKHHIIQFEGAIAEGGIVHHLEVFQCRVPTGVEIPLYDAPCSSKAERPKGLESCTKVIGAWAMGAPPLSYPEEAGQPIGGRNFNRFVMIEVHYNNPEHRKGIVDNSGIRFYYTRQLRKHDAGTMELGLEYTDKMALPPGLPRWDLVGYCIPECTRVGLPESGIKVFASQLHTHLTGRKAYTKHFRGGVELPELNRDNHFSPHYQEIRKLPRQVHVLQGDSLVTTCDDQTLDRSEITLGGFSISDEMCVNYIHYYPAAELEVCKSSVTTDSLYGFFRFLHDFQDEATSTLDAISANYKSIRWTAMNVDLLKTYYEMAPLSMQCNKSNGQRFPGHNWENRPVPTILAPMPPKERPCLE